MSKDMCIHALHEMEERYSRLVIEYHNLDQKEKIFHTVNETIKTFKLHPTQMMEPHGEFEGKFCLEFHDDYRKEAGEFFEAILKELDVDHCDLG